MSLKKWFYLCLIAAGFGMSVIPSMAQTEVSFLIYKDLDSFTIFVSGDEVVSLQGLTFEVVTGGNNDRIRYELSDFPAFTTLNISHLSPPFCLRLERAESSVVLPLECQRLEATQRFKQTLTDADVFWHDRPTNQSRSILITDGENEYGLCPSQESRCSITYTPQSADFNNPPTSTTPVVLIADFDTRFASRPVDIARRIERDLQNRLQDNDLDTVRIQVISPPITTTDEAEFALSQQNAAALIWGWYDDLGINVRIFLRDSGKTLEIPTSGEIPLRSEVDDTELSFIVRDVLPDNISFLSLFVIGHLHYLANQYQAGYAAMDAAMSSIPDEVALENQAILHFFNARQMASTSDYDVNEAICEYIEAIEIDPNFALAYLNLGVLLVQSGLTINEVSGGPYLILPSDEQYQRADECLQQLDEDYYGNLHVADLFEQALALQADWNLAEYNLIVVRDWAEYIMYDETETFPMQIKLERLLQDDPTLTGAYLILGNLAFMEGDFHAANDHFKAAVELMPDAARFQFNLAQSYRALGNITAARSSLEYALALQNSQQIFIVEPFYLALVSLELEAGELEKAEEYLALLQQGDSEISESTAISLSSYLFRRGLYEEAAQTLADIDRPGFLSRYLRFLLNEASETGDLFSEALIPQWSLEYLPLYIRTSITNNNIVTLAELSLIEQCAESNQEDARRWGSNSDCLPADVEERISAVYDIFSVSMNSYLFYKTEYFVAGGHACPHVFSYHEGDGRWLWETTILDNLVGPASETRQWQTLTRFDGRLLIKEIEPETSYIDQIYLVMVDAQGNLKVLHPDLPELHQADSLYVTLDFGESIMLNFTSYDTANNAEKIWIVAEGYYIPHKR